MSTSQTNNVSSGSVNVPGAVAAGAVATVVMTVSLAIFGMDIMAGIGGMVVGAGSAAATKYVVGGMMHFAIGIVYALVFAAIAGLARSVPRPVLGLIFGAVITPIAIYGMPVMAGMFGGSAGNPCNPCGGANPCSQVSNPCNPCRAKNPCSQAANPCDQAQNPCNPCAQPKNPCNPCNPCGQPNNPCNPCGQAKNPCNPCSETGNPCAMATASNPCNPCGGGGAGGWISLINHLIYGLALGLMYRPKGA